MSDEKLTVDQVAKFFDWSKHITILPFDFVVLRSRAEDAVGALHVHGSRTLMGRVLFDGNKVIIEKTALTTKVAVQNPAFDAAGFVNPAKLFQVFSGKDVDFKPTEEWGKAEKVLPKTLYQCEVSGKLVASKDELRKVTITDPNTDQPLKEIWVAVKELP